MPRRVSEPPKPSASGASAIREAVARILANQDAARARVALFEAVEKEAGADITDLLAPVALEDPSYRGLVSVFAEAVEEPKSEDAGLWERYNLARLQYLRGSQLPARTGRPFLATASQTLNGGKGPLRETSQVELAGDIEAALGRTDAAVAAYQRLIPLYGNAAPAQWRIGMAYRRGGRPEDAVRAFEQGVKADRFEGYWRHANYQGLGWVALDRGKIQEAGDYLKLSAKVRKPEVSDFTPRLDLAYALKDKGAGDAVREFVLAMRALVPDDKPTQALFKLIGGASQ